MRSPPRIRPSIVSLVEALWWDQDRDRFTDDLLGRISKEPLRALVPALDDAIEALANDRIITEFDDGSEPPKLLLTFAQ
jgi:hypothetical protein